MLHLNLFLCASVKNKNFILIIKSSHPHKVLPWQLLLWIMKNWSFSIIIIIIIIIIVIIIITIIIVIITIIIIIIIIIVLTVFHDYMNDTLHEPIKHFEKCSKLKIKMRCGVVVITSAQHGLITSELRLCAGSKPARGSTSEICYRENVWQWFRLEIMRKRYLSGNHSPPPPPPQKKISIQSNV